MLATFNEYHWSFLTCGTQISYKTNTVGRSVFNYGDLIWGDKNNKVLMDDMQILQKKGRKSYDEITTFILSH